MVVPPVWVLLVRLLRDLLRRTNRFRRPGAARFPVEQALATGMATVVELPAVPDAVLQTSGDKRLDQKQRLGHLLVADFFFLLGAFLRILYVFGSTQAEDVSYTDGVGQIGPS